MTSYLYPYLQESVSLNENSKDNYILTIQYSLDGLSFVVFDNNEQKFLCLKHYNITDKEVSLNSLLIELQAKENWKINDFKKVNFLIDNNNNTFIPKEYFQEENKETYLELLARDKVNYVRADELISVNSVNVYSLNEDVTTLLSQFGERIKVCHVSTILAETLVKEFSERNSETRTFVNVKNNTFELTIIDGSKLILHNYFSFSTKEDFLYFILFTFEQLKIDNETVPLYFMGLIEEKSPIVELCSRYVRNIRFFNRNNNLNYCKELDSIPYFYYYILYSSILCE